MNDAQIARRALALLDLTDLGETATENGALALCAKAISPPVPVAAICIWPRFVPAAREALAGSPVRIATVVNFPDGGRDAEPVVAETAKALRDGAAEIDLVLPWRAFLAGDSGAASAMVRAVKAACDSARLKVILETGEYPGLDAVKTASELAIAAGADFIKTSTGKTEHSASPEAAEVMLGAIKALTRPVGLKPSGGIRTLADARSYLDLADRVMGPDWASQETFRFGASGLHRTLVDVLSGREADGKTTGSY